MCATAPMTALGPSGLEFPTAHNFVALWLNTFQQGHTITTIVPTATPIFCAGEVTSRCYDFALP